MELYKSIAKTLADSGKSQADWARAAGLDPSSLNKYLLGKRDSSGSVIQRILYLMTTRQRIVTISRVGWNGGAPPEDLDNLKEFKEEIKEIERRMAQGEGLE